MGEDAQGTATSPKRGGETAAETVSSAGGKRSGAGRPRGSLAKRSRSERIEFRVFPTDLERLEHEAKKRGISAKLTARELMLEALDSIGA